MTGMHCFAAAMCSSSFSSSNDKGSTYRCQAPRDGCGAATQTFGAFTSMQELDSDASQMTWLSVFDLSPPRVNCNSPKVGWLPSLVPTIGPHPSSFCSHMNGSLEVQCKHVLRGVCGTGRRWIQGTIEKTIDFTL